MASLWIGQSRFNSALLLATLVTAVATSSSVAEFVYQPPSSAADATDAPETDILSPSYLQAPDPPANSIAAPSNSSSPSSSGGLGSVPKMHGDSFLSGTASFANGHTSTDGRIDVPLLGTGQRSKLSDNNSAIPTDRVFFIYQHFQNAIRAETVGWNTNQQNSQAFPFDRSVLGIEKTFGDKLWSIELRLPMLGSFLADASTSGPITESGGQVGNLLFAVKRLVYEGERSGIGMGIAFDTPTGSDAALQFGDDRFTIHNEAFHFAPFIGVVAAPSERWFCQGTVMLDFALNGNSIEFADPTTNVANLGSVSGQHLLYADASIGYWLYRNPRGRFLTGIAPTLEAHYTTKLNSPAGVRGMQGATQFEFGNDQDFQNIVNFTYAIQFTLNRRTNIRLGGVAPLGKGGNRTFDSEFQLSINHAF